MKKVNNLFNAGYGWGRTYPQKTRQKTVQKEESIDYSKEYLYIEALEDNTTVSFKSISPDATSSSSAYGNPYNTLEYSVDQKTWSAISEDGTASTINTGEKLYFKGECEPSKPIDGYIGIGTFVVTNKYNAGGNVMSLLFNDDFEDKIDLTGYDFVFAGLFGNIGDEGTLQSAENLLLPATTLANWCYSSMFSGCTSLTTAPELPATTLVDGCYIGMFLGCTSLTSAPVLPATKLATNCYNGMFRGCTNLNYIKILATDISASMCLYGWVEDVLSTGTFVKADGVEIPTGVDGIPEGWTVETA